MKLGTSLAVITGFYILIQLKTIIAYIKFTNFNCVTYDKRFLEFRECKLKALSRNTVALSAHIHFLQLPVNNITFNLDVYKKANGFRPFMFNITMNFCQFYRNKKRIPFGKMVMDVVELNSNLNHSCPFYPDWIFKDIVLKTKHLQSLPMPTGEYLLRISMGIHNV